jgi:hypothetical protein
LHAFSIGTCAHAFEGPSSPQIEPYFDRNAVAPENIPVCATMVAFPVHFEMNSSRLKEIASRNKNAMSSALDVSHALTSRLNEYARENIAPIDFKFFTSQLPISPLKREAYSNMRCVVVTCDVFHLLKSPSKAEALKNILRMVVTRDVSQFDKSPLNSAFPANPIKVDVVSFSPFMFVTQRVFHFGITPNLIVLDPYFSHKPATGSSAKHSRTAS